jgi:hypothetical protein
MLTRSVLAKADAYWARDFGRWPVELRPDATRVQAHTGELLGNEGIWILAVGEHPMISMPPEWLPVLRNRAQNWSRALVRNADAIVSELHPLKVTRLIGPAFIGYLNGPPTDIPEFPSVRALTVDDRDAITDLRDVCSVEEWEAGRNPYEDAPSFGAFDESGRLVALAGYQIWNRRLAHLYVITAPRQRNSGLGASVVAFAARSAIDAELVPQYRTLESNKPSMQVAEKLGFEEYGFSVYVKVSA